MYQWLSRSFLPSFLSSEFMYPDKNMSQEEVGKLCNDMEEENRVSCFVLH